MKGGAQRIAIDICTELSKRPDCEVILLYFNGTNEFEFLTKKLNVQKINISFTLSIISKNEIDLKEYEKVIDEYKPDIIHSHLYLAELVSRENVRENISYFTHSHDNMRQLNRFKIDYLYHKTKFVEYFERLRLITRYKKCRNIFIAISGEGVIFLKSNLPPAFHPRIILLHNAINTESFYIDRKYSANLKFPKLINVGNLLPNKNQVFLIKVISELIKIVNECHLTLVGEGQTRQSLEKQIIENNLSKYISLVGKKDDIKNYLADNNLYIHAAISEQFGLVLVEAMAAGLPVISLNGKGNQDVIINGYNGFIIDKNDPKLFAEKILEIFANPDLYQTLAKNAQKDAIEKYDIKIYTNKLIDVYSSSLKNQNAI